VVYIVDIPGSPKWTSPSFNVNKKHRDFFFSCFEYLLISADKEIKT